MRKVILAVMVAAMAVWLVLPASAEGELGSIRIHADPEMVESRVMLSYVGILSAGGLQLTPEFGGGYVTSGDLQTRELVAWLKDQVRDGLEKSVGEDGTVMFTGLPQGVYLLTQKQAAAGYYAMEPMLIALPEEDGSWLVQAYPKVEKQPYDPPGTGQTVTPAPAVMGMVLSGAGIGIWCNSWYAYRRKNRKS